MFWGTGRLSIIRPLCAWPFIDAGQTSEVKCVVSGQDILCVYGDMPGSRMLVCPEALRCGVGKQGGPQEVAGDSMAAVLVACNPPPPLV